MKDFKVKIISPDNEKTELNYFDILFFCQKKTEEYISLSHENLIRFRNFRKNYTIFDPYFDFVILELKYILLNPFFEKDEYLLPYNGKYYINSLYNTSINYDDLINKKPNFSFDFMPATDYNICRNKKTLNKDTRIGFCVDSEGNIYNNDILQRHLKMIHLLLNQHLIKEFGICNKYKHYIEVHGYHRKVDFFSEKLGYMIGFPSNQNTLIFNSKLLTKEQKKYLDLFQVKYKTKIEDCYRNKFIK